MSAPTSWSSRLRAYIDEWKAKSLRGELSSDEYLGDNPFPNFCLRETATSWNKFLEWQEQLHGSWCFRGQSNAEWSLSTSLDRGVRREQRDVDSYAMFHGDRVNEARRILFRFQQQAHLYLKHLPAANDTASWFALMQHHGAPTPFLDWTASPFVAAYFALEEAQRGGQISSVWAIDLHWLETTASTLLKSGEDLFSQHPSLRAERVNALLDQTVLGGAREVVAVRVSPMKSNERIAAQQGIFLCRLFPLASFSQTLMSMLIKSEFPDRPVIRKLELQSELRTDFLRRLLSVNIHRASLFPGLDGFGRSLHLDLELKDLKSVL